MPQAAQVLPYYDESIWPPGAEYYTLGGGGDDAGAASTPYTINARVLYAIVCTGAQTVAFQVNDGTTHVNPFFISEVFAAGTTIRSYGPGGIKMRTGSLTAEMIGAAVAVNTWIIIIYRR